MVRTLSPPLSLILGLTLVGCSSENNLFGGDDGDSWLVNDAPLLEDVGIWPNNPQVDAPVECLATATDPEDDPITLTYTWWNDTTGAELGTGAELQLSPLKLTPGDTLRCEVTAEDEGGKSASADTETDTICGFYSMDALDAVDFTMRMFLRPYMTEEHHPGSEGQPWDWSGDIPSWIFQFSNELLNILSWINTVYPDPTLASATAGLDAFLEIAELIDQYAPELMEGSTPPDPDIYPFMLDDEGYPYSLGPSMQWDDTYEIAIEATAMDLNTYAGMAFDMEDIDVLYDDSMGDWHDHGDMPLILWWPVFKNGGYCTSRFFNPNHEPQDTDTSYVPSSVLLLEVEVF